MVILRGQKKGAAPAMKNSHCERCARGWWCRWWLGLRENGAAPEMVVVGGRLGKRCMR